MAWMSNYIPYCSVNMITYLWPKLNTLQCCHMGVKASQNTSNLIVCLTVCSDWHHIKHQKFYITVGAIWPSLSPCTVINPITSTSLTLLKGIHWWLVDSPHKGTVMQEAFPFHDVPMTGLALGIITCVSMQEFPLWTKHFHYDYHTRPPNYGEERKIVFNS